MQTLSPSKAVSSVDLLDRIGNTPLQSINLIINKTPRQVYLKLEGKNPAGSVKDRTAYALLQELEKRGVLNDKSIVVESTSGNLGVALAYICRAKGLNFLAVVDPKTTQENLLRMRTFGARIEMVHECDSSGGYLLARLERVKKLCRSSDRYVWTDQYSNPANPYAHYSSTGPEIYRQTGGKISAVFVAVSTGGTLAGIGRYFREVSTGTKIIGVDAQGSVIFGGQSGPRKLTGIGSARQSSFLTKDVYDSHILVSDEQAFACCRALFNATNIKVGGSSGAVLIACAHYLEGHPTMNNVVCICADKGENYASTIFDERWLRSEVTDITGNSLDPIEEICLAGSVIA